MIITVSENQTNDKFSLKFPSVIVKSMIITEKNKYFNFFPFLRFLYPTYHMTYIYQ